MQRLLSMATLAILGGLSFLFLRDGSINLPAGLPGLPGQPGQQAGAYPQQQGYGAPQFGYGAPQPTQPETTGGGLFGFGSPAATPSTPAQQSYPPQQQSAPMQVPNGYYAQQPATQPSFGGQATNVFRPVSSSPAEQPVAVPQNGPTIKVASFNIQVFGKTKAAKPGVMYVLAEIVRFFDVVAIQEVRTSDDYHVPNFVKLINETGPTPRRYDCLVGPRLGNTTSTEQYAFIWDTEKIMIDPNGYYTVRDPDNLLHREPHVARFATRINPSEAFTFTLVNVHTDPDVVSMEVDALSEVYRVVRRAGGNEDDVIMLGDFNADDRHLGRITQLPGVQPLLSGLFTNTKQSALYDNFVIHRPSTSEFTGRSGVIDVMRYFNITEAQALEVSDHLPIWAEFTAYERDYTGRVATRGQVVR